MTGLPSLKKSLPQEILTKLVNQLLIQLHFYRDYINWTKKCYSIRIAHVKCHALVFKQHIRVLSNLRLIILTVGNIPIMFNEFSYVSVFFADEDREWYPGMISRIIDSSKCDYCKRLTALQGAGYKHCFMAK